MESASKQQSPEESCHGSTSGHHWRVWRTADRLEKEGLSSCLPIDRSHELIVNVVSILRQWGKKWAGEKGWQGFLNKSSLLHEIEESIVALHSLLQWMETTSTSTSTSTSTESSSSSQQKEVVQQHVQQQPITVVDVCCGKGVFSMLASYVFQNDSRVGKIVMLDKAEIDWNHVEAANEDAIEEKRPMIESWGGCNLHDVDRVVVRLEALEAPLALVGIHLCKMLSPVCVGIVNAIGPSRCPFLCLAPCCLPRIVTKKFNKRKDEVIQVPQYETPEQRESRRLALQRRNDATKRSVSTMKCYLCKSVEHPIHKCPILPKDKEEKTEIFKKAAALVPCWKCGVVGHFKADCPSEQPSVKPTLVTPPVVCMEVAKVLEAEKPFDMYCKLLTETLQRNGAEILETGLVNDSAQHQSEGNWNSARKSIYIVATAEQSSLVSRKRPLESVRN